MSAAMRRALQVNSALLAALVSNQIVREQLRGVVTIGDERVEITVAEALDLADAALAPLSETAASA